VTTPDPHQLEALLKPLLEATGATLVPTGSMQPSDVTLMWEGVPVAAVRLPPLHGALDRVIDGVERELGGKLSTLSRDGKQMAIRMLDERGAFVLRRAVEDIADVMGVSRITIYNYLNALHRNADAT
jgi:hypothetical protein